MLAALARGEQAADRAEFTAALQQVQARRLLVFLDCCHASGMTTARDASASRADDARNDLEERHHYILTSFHICTNIKMEVSDVSHAVAFE